MNDLDRRPIVYHTINELLTAFSGKIDGLWLVAPEFDRGGLDFVGDYFGEGAVKIYYGHDDSPLLRMLQATADKDDDDYVLRVNGINFCVDTAAARNNIVAAQLHGYDCIRFPDNFPAMFTSDVYRVGALRKMGCDGGSGIERKFHIHPKYFMSRDPRFQCAVSQPDISKYSDDFLISIRECCKRSLHAKRIDVDTRKSIRAGDAISLHYELAKLFLKDDDCVLDLACGSGFGTKILSEKAKSVIGIDNDLEIIKSANANLRSDRIGFIDADAFDLPFASGSLDCVVAFEIIEHIDPIALLSEIRRVLKPGGTVILSTPQNLLGHIPITPDHDREFSVGELTDVVGQFFSIKKSIGIKQGTIFFDDDPIGVNTFMVATSA